MKHFERPPLQVEVESGVISRLIRNFGATDWDDPKTYDLLINHALRLIEASTYARVEVMKNLKG